MILTLRRRNNPPPQSPGSHTRFLDVLGKDVANFKELYCILASCYIRFTLNICSFVHQCYKY
jgi:hypothetical protein